MNKTNLDKDNCHEEKFKKWMIVMGKRYLKENGQERLYRGVAFNYE